MSLSLNDRVRGSLWGIFIADALSMPVHWYYDVASLRRDFGVIRGYCAPKERHPTSIMNLASTATGGRGQQQGSIVGDVILKGKKHLWGTPGRHYHHNMQPGENTLNALCCRVLVRNMVAEKKYNAESYLTDYVTFMTTEGSHNDTYAESYHRDFFENYASGKRPLSECAGKEKHDTPSVGGFVTLPPLVYALTASNASSERVSDSVTRHLFLTHRSQQLAQYAVLYANLLKSVLEGADLREASRSTAAAIGIDLEGLLAQGKPDEYICGRHFGMACYITDSFPIVLYLAYKYAGRFEEGVLANTNCGGENCHRGSALGALLGAGCGVDGVPAALRQGLFDSKNISSEIDQFANLFAGQAPSSTL